MYQIHGLTMSANTTKTIYIAEALGVDYEYIAYDFSKGEHKKPDHLKRHPLGKLPTLTHDGKTLFESSVICSYLASIENSPLYPADDIFYRAKIDQWASFFTHHPGRWLNTYAFQKVRKAQLGFGEPNEATIKEALGYLQEQLPVVNTQLENNTYIAGEEPSIADYIAFSYAEMHEAAEFSLSDFPAIARWFDLMKTSDAVINGRKKLAETA